MHLARLAERLLRLLAEGDDLDRTYEREWRRLRRDTPPRHSILWC
jgi:hypothetical protein